MAENHNSDFFRELNPGQLKAFQEMIFNLKSSKPDTAARYRDEFNIPKEFLQSDEVKNAIKESLVYSWSVGREDIVEEVLSKFELSGAEVREAAKQGLINALKDGEAEVAVKVKNYYNFTDDIIKSAEVQEAAQICKDFLEKEGQRYSLKDDWRFDLLAKEFGV